MFGAALSFRRLVKSVALWQTCTDSDWHLGWRSPPISNYIRIIQLLSDKWKQRKYGASKVIQRKTVDRNKTACFAWFVKLLNPTDTNTHLLSFVLSLPFVFLYDQSHHLTHSSIFFMNNRLCPNFILISTCFMQIFQMLNWTETKDML